MKNLPDLVRDSELQTRFQPDCNGITIHTYHERSPYSRGLIARAEHWRRLRRVGGGGFGTVWLERCTEGRRDDDKPELRAVKQLDLERRSTQLDFRRELEAMAKFSQWKYERCFVKSFGWYRSPEHLFIAMEYLEMGDLHSYLQQNSPLPESEAKDIAYQVLDGLCLMHDNGYTHRDLKLNNILVKSGPPNGWWIKIADFGISKRIEDGLGIPTTTRGTSGYMAPELLGFTERGNPYATDVWAVGEITFRLLTGKPTFANPGLLYKYVERLGNFPFSLLERSRVSKSAIDFILFAMRPIPNQRMTATEALNHTWVYQSATEPPITVTLTESRATNCQSIPDFQDEEMASWDTVTHPRQPSTAHPVNLAPTGWMGVHLPPLKPVFGVSLIDLYSRDGTPVPRIVYKCCEAIELFGLYVDSIYRTPGNSNSISYLKSYFDHDASNFEPAKVEQFDHDVNNMANLLKLFFQELPDPLLTSQAYGAFISAARIEDEIDRRDAVHTEINNLPDAHYATLRALTLHLYKVQSNSAQNSMTATALGICLGPSLMGADHHHVDALLHIRVAETIFRHTFQIFDDD